jgi:hypothetical protein
MNPITKDHNKLMIVSTTYRGHAVSLAYTGGRLADVHMDGKLVDAVQVGDWDWNPAGGGSARQSRAVTRDELTADLAAWVADQGDTYINELPYL